MFLSFNSACYNSFNKIFLTGNIQNQDRNDSQHCHCHHRSYINHTSIHALEKTDSKRYRIFLWLLQIDHRCKIIIPGIYKLINHQILLSKILQTKNNHLQLQPLTTHSELPQKTGGVKKYKMHPHQKG